MPTRAEKAAAKAKAKAAEKAKATTTATIKANPYDCKRPVPDLQNYRCTICKQTFNNLTFDIQDERDCPICDNRDCVKKI